MYDYRLFDDIKSEIKAGLISDKEIKFEQEKLGKDVGFRNDAPKFRLHLRWLEERGLLKLQDTPNGYIITPTDKGIDLFRSENFSFVKDILDGDEDYRDHSEIREPSNIHMERRIKWLGPLLWLSIISFLMALFSLLKLYDII